MEKLQDEIYQNISDAQTLEKLYRNDHASFKKAFITIKSKFPKTELIRFWEIRLDENDIPSLTSSQKNTYIIYLLISCLLASFLAKYPDIFNLGNEFAENYYPRNIGFIGFSGLFIFHILTNTHKSTKFLNLSMLLVFCTVVFINIMPFETKSDTFFLSCLHIPLLLWGIYGFMFSNFELSSYKGRVNFLKYNGDLLILSAIILICWGLLSAVTIGLFQVINIEIMDFYTQYVIPFELVSTPIIATFIYNTNPEISNKIAPLIARIFSPLLLITLIIYLITSFFSGKNIYADREFLLIFNVMLLGVMAIIVFSISELLQNGKSKWGIWTLFLLCIVSIIANTIALSAIIYRLGEYGFTPNRTAVLGSNLLIFSTLILLFRDIYKITFKDNSLDLVEKTVAKNLPYYAIWTIIVIFLFPFIFGLQ